MIRTIGEATRLAQATLNEVAADGVVEQVEEAKLREVLSDFPAPIVDRMVREAHASAQVQSRQPSLEGKIGVIQRGPSATSADNQATLERLRNQLAGGGVSMGGGFQLSSAMAAAMAPVEARPVPMAELASFVADLPSSEQLGVLRTIHTLHLAGLIAAQPPSADRDQLIEFLTSDRRRVFLALASKAPADLFSDALLERHLTSPADILAAVTAQPLLSERLMPRLHESPRAIDTIIEAAKYETPPATVMMGVNLADLDPVQRDEMVRIQARALEGVIEQMGTIGGPAHMMWAMVGSLPPEVLSNPSFALELVQRGRPVGQYLPLSSYPEDALYQLLQKDPELWQHLPEAMRTDPVFQRDALGATAAIIRVPQMRDDLAPGVLDDPELVIRLAIHDGLSMGPPKPGEKREPWSLLALAPNAISTTEMATRYLHHGGKAEGLPQEVLTAELAEAAVFDRTENLLHIPREMWTDELVLSSVRYETSPFLIERLAPELAKWPRMANREFQQKLVETNALLLPFVDPDWSESSQLAERVVQRQGAALEYFAPHIRHNPDLVLAAAQSDPNALFNSEVDLTLPIYRDAILDGLRRQPLSYLGLPIELRHDPEIARVGAPGLVPLKNNSLPLPPDGSVVPTDPELLRELLNIQIGAIAFVPPSYLRDPEFMAEAVRIFPPLLDDLPDGSVSRSALLGLHPELETLAAPYRAKFERFGFTDAFRFGNRRTLDAIIRTRQQTKPSGRPRALVILGTDDHNGAFRVSSLPTLTEHFDVHYYEVSEDHEAFEAWQHAATAGPPLHHVTLGGHGTRFLLALGADDPASSFNANESQYVDLGDADEIREKLANLTYQPGATLILQSCSNGRGRSEAFNLANMMANASGLPTHSAINPTNSMAVVDADLNVSGAFRGGQFQTYVAQPGTSRDYRFGSSVFRD